jgi:hypothetical protein
MLEHQSSNQRDELQARGRRLPALMHRRDSAATAPQ